MCQTMMQPTKRTKILAATQSCGSECGRMLCIYIMNQLVNYYHLDYKINFQNDHNDLYYAANRKKNLKFQLPILARIQITIRFDFFKNIVFATYLDIVCV